jgi:hypothetical protein
MFSNFILGEVTSITAKDVKLKDGKRINFDYLIIGLSIFLLYKVIHHSHGKLV